MTYLTLGVGHLGPSLGTLVRHILGLSVATQLGSNGAAVVLHVQEVGGQGALGSIGINRRALPLLTTGLRLGTGAGSTVKVGGSQADGHSRDINGGGTAVNNAVHMLNVGLAQISDVGLQSHQAHKDLLGLLVGRFIVA